LSSCSPSCHGITGYIIVTSRMGRKHKIKKKIVPRLSLWQQNLVILSKQCCPGITVFSFLCCVLDSPLPSPATTINQAQNLINFFNKVKYINYWDNCVCMYIYHLKKPLSLPHLSLSRSLPAIHLYSYTYAFTFWELKRYRRWLTFSH